MKKVNKREIIIGAAFISKELTGIASNMILRTFGGYFLNNGEGGYTFQNGEIITERSLRWTIGTSASIPEINRFMIRFALVYCERGSQESVYYADECRNAFLFDKFGKILE